NFIGTDVSGTAALGNTADGVAIAGASGNTVGGTTAAARNVIAGNIANGIQISAGATSNLIAGNFIGTDSGGIADLGNTAAGVRIASSNNTVGGTTAGARNTIAFNAGDGVVIASGTGNVLLGNAIFTNARLGINL